MAGQVSLRPFLIRNHLQANGPDPLAGSATNTINASNALRMPHLKDGQHFDEICDDGPVLSPRPSQPKGITKRQVERCISELEHWSDQELNDVIDMFQSHGLVETAKQADKLKTNAVQVLIVWQHQADNRLLMRLYGCCSIISNAHLKP